MMCGTVFSLVSDDGDDGCDDERADDKDDDKDDGKGALCGADQRMEVQHLLPAITAARCRA